MPLPQGKYYTVEDYFNMPDDIRAELINGQLFHMATPSTLHQRISHDLCFAITSYIKSKGGECEVFPAPFAVQLSAKDDTVVEPDITVICDTDKLTDRGCVGAPDWVIEIVSPSSVKHDYITKLNLYNNAGVCEYWIVDAMQERIYVYDMHSSNFILIPYTFKDKIKVNIYEDLYIDFSSLNLNI